MTSIECVFRNLVSVYTLFGGKSIISSLDGKSIISTLGGKSSLGGSSNCILFSQICEGRSSFGDSSDIEEINQIQVFRVISDFFIEVDASLVVGLVAQRLYSLLPDPRYFISLYLSVNIGDELTVKKDKAQACKL